MYAFSIESQKIMFHSISDMYRELSPNVNTRADNCTEITSAELNLSSMKIYRNDKLSLRIYFIYQFFLSCLTTIEVFIHAIYMYILFLYRYLCSQ